MSGIVTAGSSTVVVMFLLMQGEVESRFPYG